MPVVGLVIRNISAKKNEEFIGAAQISNNANIKSIEEQNLIALGKPSLKIGFEYKSDYLTDKKKSYAEIVINGDVFFADGPSEKVIDGWKKEKKLPDAVNLHVINTILHKCMIESLGLSEKLQLPPPVQLPFAQPSTPRADAPQSKYIG
ncbi:MAG TPA: hypothetical protein VI933_00525 [archaeon]|nr:hypothetical protein [archaeon]